MGRTTRSQCQQCGIDYPRNSRSKGKICPICKPPEDNAKKSQGAFWKVIFFIAFAVGGLFLQQRSFTKISQIRQIARIPHTSIAAAITGEVNLTGRGVLATENGTLLKAPKTGTECFYFSYLLEREERDSDGDTTWVTVENYERSVPFELKDGSGQILIRQSSDIDYSLKKDYYKTIGSYRYTERRIDRKDRLFILGYLQKSKDSNKPEIVFDHKGDYTPILSDQSEQGERRNKLTNSIWTSWSGLGLVALSISTFFSLIRQHRILVFFGLLTFVVSLVLFIQGFAMMKTDLLRANERIHRQEKVAKEVLSEELAKSQTPWDGSWATLGGISRFDDIPGKTRVRLKRIRIDLATAARRVSNQRQSFPYRYLAPILALQPLPEVPLTERDEQSLRKLEKEFVPTQVSSRLAYLTSAAALLLGTLTFFVGREYILEKRFIENLPTTPTAGVNYGMVEVAGIVDQTPSLPPLSSPIFGSRCVYYHYTISERRGSGNKKKWVVIHKETKKQPFLCLDRSGFIPVLFDKSTPECVQVATKRVGNRKLDEITLQLGEPLYVLGNARLDEQAGDSLLIAPAKKDKSTPFIVSSFSEDHLVRSRGFMASLSLSLTFSAVLLAGLMALGTAGNLNPASFLSAALLGPVFMILFTILLHYNDLVFLKQRARRAWSNIEVALQKRNDLIPSLQEMAKAVLTHEKELLDEVASLRTQVSQTSITGKKLSADQQVSRKLFALREAYPELTSGENMEQLSRQLVLCENEIAFASQSFNDSVETYNTRIASLPDLLLARPFGFKPIDLLQSDLQVIEVPSLDLTIDEASSESSQTTSPPPLPNSPPPPPTQ